MIGLLGKKVGMTQIFDNDGRSVPVTVIQAGPCHVTQVRTETKDGYTAVQLGFDVVRAKVLTQPKLGQLKKANVPPVRFIREIRTGEVENVQVGAQVKVDNFEAGDYVDVEGVTIGKGFQGVIKRHGFKGGCHAHGSKFGREPGSIGSNTSPARVLKGLKMSGHMGSDVQTTQNLKVVKVDAENDLLCVRGAVPGPDGAYVVVFNSLKKGKSKKWKVVSAADNSAPESSSPKAAS